MLSLNKILLLTITFSSVIAAASITYYYVYALSKKDSELIALQKTKKIVTPTPSPKVSPTASQSATPSQIIAQWTFGNNQYDASVSNVIYTSSEPTPSLGPCTTSPSECNYQQILVKTKYQISLQSQIIATMKLKNISVTPFITSYVLYNCKTNNSTIHANFSMATWGIGVLPNETKSESITGNFVDLSGNKVNPPSDIKVSSCTLSLTTINSKTIEPKVIQF